MAWALLDRLRKWKPMARNIVTGLIRIAAGAVASVHPESELLIRAVGGASEAAADHFFESLPDEQKQLLENQLLPLLEKHGELISRFENTIEDQQQTVEQLIPLLQQSLLADSSLRTGFQEFADDVSRLQDSLNRIENKIDALHEDVRSRLDEIHRRFDRLDTRPKSPYWISIHEEDDVRWLSQLYQEVRTWSPEQRRELKVDQYVSLLIDSGQSEMASDLSSEAEELCSDPLEQAHLLMQKMRADLERQANDDALLALRQAIEHDVSCAPFPTHQFEPQRILGIGGAGTAILCHDRYEGRDIVVKCLHAEGLDRNPLELFREVALLRRLAEAQPDTIVRVHSCGFTEPTAQRAPYIVMDYFPGESLQKYLDRRAQGLELAEFLPVAKSIARGLQSAHALGILHRDVKPENVLVRSHEDGSLEARLIDFGLAVKCEVARTSQMAPQKSLQGMAVAGTVEFAAPEQMGKRADPVGPYSDVYGFGRFCCYALFRTTTPLNRHWRGLPEGLRDLIEKCLEEEPAERFPSFEEILPLLGRCGAGTLSPQEGEAPAEPRKEADQQDSPPPAEPRKEADQQDTPPPASTSSKIRVEVLGTWHTQSAGTQDPDAWSNSVSTPATVSIQPDEVYRLELYSEVTDSDLQSLTVFQKVPAFQSLSLASCSQLTDASWEHLQRLTSLQDLDLSGCNGLTNRGLAHLSKLTGLRSLNLALRVNLIDKGLSYLEPLTALESLNLTGCTRLTDEGLAHLKQLPRLRTLNLSYCECPTNAGMVYLKGIRSLQSLNLAGCKHFKGEGISRIVQLRGLLSLNFDSCDQLKDSRLTTLANATSLQELNLRSCGLSDEVLMNLRGLNSLRTLVLAGCNVSDETLSWLGSSVSSLQHLDLAGCRRITDKGLQYLSDRTSLRYLDLEQCNRLTDKGISQLRELTSLEHLGLEGCPQLTDAGVVHLKNLTALRHLSLAMCRQVTDSGLMQLKNLTSLESLDLSWSGVSGKGLLYLKKLTSLQELHLEDCLRVTDTTLGYLERIPSLRDVNVRSCPVSDTAIAELRAALPECNVMC